MKKAAKILLTIGWIVAIVGFVAFIVGAICYTIGGVSFFKEAASIVPDDTSETRAKIASLAMMGYLFIVAAIAFLVSSPLFMVAFAFARKGKATLLSAKSRGEARGMAITNIVFGALTADYPLIVAGVLMLTMSDEKYQEQI